jgi:hypothetical protein
LQDPPQFTQSGIFGLKILNLCNTAPKQSGKRCLFGDKSMYESVKKVAECWFWLASFSDAQKDLFFTAAIVIGAAAAFALSSTE